MFANEHFVRSGGANMKIQKEDRRSLRTQQLLADALVELMQEKRYDSITVQDILDQANIGRSTFYAHYQDKEDLLVSSLESVLDQFVEHIEYAGQPILSTEAFFQHVKEHEHLYKAMVWGRGIDLLFDKGQAQLSRKIEAHLAAQVESQVEPSIPLSVIATFLSGAFLTLLKWWVEQKMLYTPQQMSAMYNRLTMFGTLSVLKPGLPKESK
jgi:AcrR family transcriptional regulator